MQQGFFRNLARPSPPAPPLHPVRVGGGPTPTPLNFLFVSVSFLKSSIFYQNDLHQGSLKNLARPSPPPTPPGGGWRGTDPDPLKFSVCSVSFLKSSIFYQNNLQKCFLKNLARPSPPPPPTPPGGGWRVTNPPLKFFVRFSFFVKIIYIL